MPAPFLGILSLDTAFPRIIGDAGNVDSYPFEARVHVVQGADASAIVQDKALDPELLEAFIAAAKQLEAEGARALVSTCGFLATAQKDVAAAVSIPVFLSALTLFPIAQLSCPGRIGVITASRQALGETALRACGISRSEVVIAGLEHSQAFAQTFLARKDQQNTTLDQAAIERDVVEAALSLKADNPDMTAILFECGNLPPYALAVEAATGLTVFHSLHLGKLLF